MTNQDVAPLQTQAMSDFQRNIAAAAEKQVLEVGFTPILKFHKHGKWLLGADKDNVTPGAQFVIRSASIQEGWIGWQNQKVVKEIMRAISGESVEDIHREPIAQIQDGDGWYEQYAFEGKFLADGNPAVFKTSSQGGKGAVFSVIKEIAVAFKDHPAFLNPVVALEVVDYKHPKWGTIYKPEFEVITWMANDSEELLSQQKTLEGEDLL